MTRETTENYCYALSFAMIKDGRIRNGRSGQSQKYQAEKEHNHYEIKLGEKKSEQCAAKLAPFLVRHPR